MALLAVASFVVAGAAAHAVRPTAAAWQDPAYARATVSTAGWTVNSCQVRNGDGTVATSVPCTVQTGATVNYWGNAGSGQGNFSVSLNAPGISNTQYFTFTLTIPTATAPAWWSWANASITGTNNGITFGSRCAVLPQFSGTFPPNRGATVNVYIAFADNRSATPLCVTP